MVYRHISPYIDIHRWYITIHHHTWTIYKADTEDGRSALVDQAKNWQPDPELLTPAEEDDSVEFASPALLVTAAGGFWWPYVRVLTAPVCILADPFATHAQHARSLEVRFLVRE